jgi:hypothetical protein
MISSESYIIFAVTAVLALVALIYLLSPKMSLLDDLTTRGAEIRKRLWDLLERHAYPDDERSVWVAGCIAVALEHHEAISLLINRQLTGSAFALVRPMVETVVRAHWINAVANDDQVAQAREDKNVFPSMSKMGEAVGKAYGDDELFQRFTSEWGAMCSYTHSGARQIALHFTGTEIKPSYKEGAKVQVLNLTNIALLFLARMFFMSTGHQTEASETRTMLLDHAPEFGERLRNGGGQ